MQNYFRNTTFEFGLTKYESLPDDIGTEVVLCGRSNAGKSTALNRLTENSKLARTSKTPGRTTEINFFRVDAQLRLLDLPGYGYARSQKNNASMWDKFMSDYFSKRKSLKAAVLFMDIRHPLKELDLQIIELCRKNAVDLIPVLTKSDKLSNQKIALAKKSVSSYLVINEIINVSVNDSKGFQLLRETIWSYLN
tara:strand:+ start:160 stop:741 length:582 start_codon:yes stop_codon:yes gene_type:complete